jgi:hypothetical protein
MMPISGFQVGSVIVPVEILGSAQRPAQSDDAWNVHTEWAIAAHAQDATMPDDLPNLLQISGARPAFPSVKSPHGVEHLVGRHVYGIPVLRSIQKAALRTHGAADAKLEHKSDPGAILVQELLDRWDDRSFTFPEHAHLQSRLPLTKLNSLPTPRRVKKKNRTWASLVKGMQTSMSSPLSICAIIMGR